MARVARDVAALGVPLALAAALLAVASCRSREGERCVCAEDCREGLVCVASGRVLAEGECSPAVGDAASPGVCLSEDEAAEDDGGGGPVEPFMDMGSKLDFEPGPPPDVETEGATSETTEGGVTTEAPGTGTTEATGSSGSTTDATGSSGSTTDASGSTSSSGSTTDATGSSGSTSVGT